MIILHRIGADASEFHLNPDLIVTVEACPDTVISLSTGAKIVVAEDPDYVASEIRAWRASIATDALAGHGRPAPVG